MERIKKLFPFLSIFSFFCLFIGYDFFDTFLEKIIFSLFCFFFFFCEAFLVLKKEKNIVYSVAYGFGFCSYLLFHIRNYLSFYFFDLENEYLDILLKIQDIFLILLVLSSTGYVLFIFLLKLSSHSILHKNPLQIKKQTLIKNSILNFISFFILMISINYVASIKNKIFDLSSFNYTFSPYGKKIISSIKEKINIIAFYPHILENLEKESQLNIHKTRLDLEILLNELSILNPNIQVEWANADIDKEKTLPFGQVENGTIFFRSQTTLDKTLKQEKILIQSEEDLKQAEKKIIQALFQVFQKTQKFYFTQSNGERFSSIYQRMKNLQIQKFKNAFLSYNYQLEPLETLSIPKDADGLLIIGATKKFSSSQQREILLYLQTGGKIFLCIDPKGQANFSWLLKHWNIKFQNKNLIDSNSKNSNFLFTEHLNQELVTSPFEGLFFPYSGFLEILNLDDRIKIIVESSFEVFIDKNRNLSLDKNEVQKKFILAALLEFSKQKKSKVLVFSSTAWLSDEYIHSYSNMDFALQSIDFLMRKYSLDSIPSRKFNHDFLRLNRTQKKWIWILTMFVYPLFILCCCFLVKKTI